MLTYPINIAILGLVILLIVIKFIRVSLESRRNRSKDWASIKTGVDGLMTKK